MFDKYQCTCHIEPRVCRLRSFFHANREMGQKLAKRSNRLRAESRPEKIVRRVVISHVNKAHGSIHVFVAVYFLFIVEVVVIQRQRVNTQQTNKTERRLALLQKICVQLLPSVMNLVHAPDRKKNGSQEIFDTTVTAHNRTHSRLASIHLSATKGPSVSFSNIYAAPL